MEVRNKDGLYPARIDSGRTHVVQQLSGGEDRLRIVGLHLTAASRIAERELAVDVDHQGRNWDRNEIGAQPSSCQGLLGLFHAGVAKVGRIVRFLPDAVVESGTHRCPDAKAMETRHWIRRLGAAHGRADCEWPIKTEGGCRYPSRQNDIPTCRSPHRDTPFSKAILGFWRTARRLGARDTDHRSQRRYKVTARRVRHSDNASVPLCSTASTPVKNLSQVARFNSPLRHSTTKKRSVQETGPEWRELALASRRSR